MTFVIPPTLESPGGAPQLLAALGQDLVSFRAEHYGDERREAALSAAAHLGVTDQSSVPFWIGAAADAYGRSALASANRVRRAFRALSEGGRAATDLAAAISAAQATMFEAQTIASARARQASTNPIPTDPLTLFGDLLSTQRAVQANLEEAHRRAATTWNRLTQSAPHHVAPEKKAAGKKRPFWKRVESIADKVTYVPGPIGMVASAGMAGVKLAQGDVKGALDYGAGAAPGYKQLKLVGKGAHALHGAGRVKDTSRVVSRVDANVRRSVGGPGAAGRGPGGVNGPGGRPNRLPDQNDQAPHVPPQIPKVPGARGDAGANAGNRHPGEPRLPRPNSTRDAKRGTSQPNPRPRDQVGRPQVPRPTDIHEGVKNVLDRLGSLFGLRLQGPRPQPLLGSRPNGPTVVFPAARPRPA